MSRFNTGNPLGSGSPLDLDDNAKNLDEAANSSADTFKDRLGNSRLTWSGIVKSGTGDPSVAVDAAVRANEAADRAEDAEAGVEQNAEQIAQDAAQQAASSVISGVDGQVAVAQSAADRAEAALEGVEQALDLGAANIYLDVASGLAATEDTDNFWVVPNEGDGIENLTLYNNNASEAVKLYELYNLDSYMIEEGANWETGEL